MRWGRRQTPRETKPDSGSGARAVMILGSILCAVFLAAAAGENEDTVRYPDTMSSAARQAFLRDHGTLAAVLALDVYFPEEAVYAGSFDLPPGERWTFSRYLRDAFGHLLFGETE